MLNEQIEYNKRQIDLMGKKIIFFKEGKLDIYNLISDLSGLLNCIQHCNKDWVARFQSQLGTLDTVFANSIYENRTTLTQLEQSLINKSLEIMNELINEYKNKYLR